MTVITAIRSAFGFLTRLPVGPWPLQNDLNGISAWLPLVGIVVGGLVGGLTFLSSLLFSPLLCGVIGCACWVAVTGGLHLDGVADCGDGLPVEVTQERRLEIMKDSRLGTFGGTALFFNLAFKAAALAVLAASGSWPLLLTACILAGLLARSQIFIAMRFPGARPGGMGEAFRQGTRPVHALIAAAVTLGACVLQAGPACMPWGPLWPHPWPCSCMPGAGWAASPGTYSAAPWNARNGLYCLPSAPPYDPA